MEFLLKILLKGKKNLSKYIPLDEIFFFKEIKSAVGVCLILIENKSLSILVPEFLKKII